MPAITQLNDNSKFLKWKDVINELITSVGNTDSLTTTEKSNLVASINELKSRIDNNQSDILVVDTEMGDITTLTTTNKTNVVNAMNELVGEIDVNIIDIGDITSDVGDITTLTTLDKSNLVNAVNELDTHVAPDVYYPNADNGRFAADLGISAITFDGGNLLNLYNASVITEGHKFINDNANNGGGGGTMGADAVSLTNFLSSNGRTELRYGYEFFIMDLTPGGGTLDVIVENSINYYPVISSLGLYLGSIGDTISWSGYVKNTDLTDNILIGNNDPDITTWVNGVTQPTPLEVSDADGWVYVRQAITLTQEYKTLFPAISATSNSAKLNIALSALYRANNKTQHLGVVH